MLRRILLLLLAFSWLTGFSQSDYKNLSNLPAVYIETFDGNGIYSKEVYEYCRLFYVNESGTTVRYDSVSIRGRGNSTWKMSKKPYRIKFLSKEKFLGTGYAKCKSWTLLANAGDKTMMRNAVTSAMGTFCAELHGEGEAKSLPFSPAAKFVDMVINGTYQGTYQISDQVDVRPHRVNITEQNVPLGDTDDISGGYLLEVDGFRDGNFFNTDAGWPVRIHYPDDEEIVARQTSYIKNHVNTFERVLNSANFADAENGYRAYVDTASLIDWYICTEVSANIDGFYSTYFYKERGNDRLFWGPLWDYDIAYNNDQRVRTEQGLVSSVNSMMVDIAYSGSREWMRRMWEDEWFQKKVYYRFKQIVEAGLVDYMHHKIDSLQQLLSESQALNYQKWGISTKMYHELVLYTSYDQYVSDLKTFITERCAYLEKAFLDRKPAEPTPPFVAGNFYYKVMNAKTKKVLDLSNLLVVQNEDASLQESQDWMVQPLGNGLFQLVNRSAMMALNDPTQGSSTATTNVGTQLNVAAVDANSPRQQWQLVPQGTQGYYNLLNSHTQHVANLSGGSANNGVAILSYTNDSRNGVSENRLWYLVPNGELPDDVTGIAQTEPEDYALAYNPTSQELHFGSATPEALTFTAQVYQVGGQQVGTFVASDRFSMAAFPRGIYIVSWRVGNQMRSVKFSK